MTITITMWLREIPMHSMTFLDQHDKKKGLQTKMMLATYVARPQSIHAYRMTFNLPRHMLSYSRDEALAHVIGQNDWRQNDIELEESNLRNNNRLFLISSSFPCHSLRFVFYFCKIHSCHIIIISWTINQPVVISLPQQTT